MRPAAGAALPALHAAAPATPIAATNGHTNGAHTYAVKAHPANAHLAVPIAMRTDDAGSQPILPPRQTARMQASGTSSSGSTWKSWPVVVIAIAVIAIITAVILIVWPPDSAPADAKTLAPPPAPERMDTNPLPPSSTGPQGNADPWSTRPWAAPDPAPSQPAPQPAVPDIDDIQPPDLSDPFRGGGIGGMGTADRMLGVLGAATQRLCDRLASCPTATDTTVQMMCGPASRLAIGQLPPPPTCSAMQRCLAAVDRVPCDTIDSAAVFGLVQGLQACEQAMRC